MNSIKEYPHNPEKFCSRFSVEGMLSTEQWAEWKV